MALTISISVLSPACLQGASRGWVPPGAGCLSPGAGGWNPLFLNKGVLTPPAEITSLRADKRLAWGGGGWGCVRWQERGKRDLVVGLSN